jgi:hypothetical protein
MDLTVSQTSPGFSVCHLPVWDYRGADIGSRKVRKVVPLLCVLNSCKLT